MLKKIVKYAIIIVVLGVLLAIGVPYITMISKSGSLNGDYTKLKDDTKYNTKVEVTGLNLVTQKITCGYATIEMITDFYGTKVTEEDLSKKNNGSITTSSSDGFLRELKSSTNKNYSMKSYLNNNQLLKTIHDSLEKNNPVPIEWAAKYNNEWTLHFSIVTSLDVINDNVTIYNPYGYIENIKISDFLERTSFRAYSNMPLFLQFGFMYNSFHKNVVFVIA